LARVLNTSNVVLQAEVQQQEHTLQASADDLRKQQQALQLLDEKVSEQKNVALRQNEREQELQLALQEQWNRAEKQRQAAQAQEQEISASDQAVQQIAMPVLRDMAAVSLKNDGMRAVLEKNGYTVTVQKK
jgi:hypothetical protein